jgi:hypothetical protein
MRIGAIIGEILGFIIGGVGLIFIWEPIKSPKLWVITGFFCGGPIGFIVGGLIGRFIEALINAIRGEGGTRQMEGDEENSCEG